MDVMVAGRSGAKDRGLFFSQLACREYSLSTADEGQAAKRNNEDKPRAGDDKREPSIFWQEPERVGEATRRTTERIKPAQSQKGLGRLTRDTLRLAEL